MSTVHAESSTSEGPPFEGIEVSVAFSHKCAVEILIRTILSDTCLFKFSEV